MNVLLLGPPVQELTDIVLASGDAVRHWEDSLLTRQLVEWHVDFLISFRYRHLVTPEVLDLLPNRAINLHTSYLPWNRGADPNLWSFVDDTPKGVTIHHMDQGLDTGDIIAQQRVEFAPDTETLAGTYSTLCQTILRLFSSLWPEIRLGNAPRKPQPSGGSFHRLADRAAIAHLLTAGWDTPTSALRTQT